LVAEEFEAQVPLGELCFRIALGGPDAVVEAGDVAAAIFALGDLALEAGVVDRMVFHFHRHALDRGVVARALGHRPAFQRVADLQPEIVVPPAGMVQLHHEDRALAARQGLARFGFAGLVEAALAAVFDQAHAGAPVLEVPEPSPPRREHPVGAATAASALQNENTRITNHPATSALPPPERPSPCRHSPTRAPATSASNPRSEQHTSE